MAHWLDIYEVAHYCIDHKREFSHSQGAWEGIKRSCLSPGQPVDHRIVTAETKYLSRDDEKRKRQWLVIAHNMERNNRLSAGIPKDRSVD